MEKLTIYNTLTRQKEEFQPLNPPFVGMYVCGPTVYGDAHLGHARPAITFDIVFRYLQYLDYKVRYVRNITDVGHLVNDADEGEDKLQKRAKVEQLEPMEVAQKYLDRYNDDIGELNVLNPSIQPRATGHIPEQIEMVQKILENGFAYVSNGSVYMDVPKYDAEYGYGKLSGRKLEDMYAGTRELDGQDEKRHPADFALWKKASENHIMRWNSPWGVGFPGWHIECTVMSTKYLGPKYDIHGGGMDLIFPHHESEIVQSNACSHGQAHAHEQDEAKYWLHNNMITLNGQKMSKSLGNTVNLRQFFTGENDLLVQGYSPMTIRYFILQAHYRSTIDFSNEALQASEKSLKRVSEAIVRLNEMDFSDQPVSSEPNIENNLKHLLKKCENFMNDDFNTAKVIAKICKSVSIINRIYTKRNQPLPASIEVLEQFRKNINTVFFDWLGLKIEEESTQSNEVVEGLMQLIIDIRKGARSSKNWALADQIRDELDQVHIKLKDSTEGTEWYYEES